jgi:hypothetical protein
VKVMSVEENSDSGKEILALYFNYRKFLLWRLEDDANSTLDYTDITRSWSSLADEADDMDGK